MNVHSGNGRYHVRHSIVLEENDGGTRLSYFLEPLEGRTLLPKLIVKLMGSKIRIEIEIERTCQSCLTTQQEMVDVNLAAGKLTPP